MNECNPQDKSKDQYTKIIELIGSDKSAVGIDAQYTHAIIIEYLEKLTNQLSRIEKKLDSIS